jgi:hypothetical protein
MSGESLEQLVNELGRLMNAADACGTDADGIKAKLEIEKQISALVGDTEAKVDTVGGYLLKFDRRAATLKAEAKELLGRAQTFEKRYAWLKKVVAFAMLAQGFKKLEGCRVTMTRLNGRETLSIDDLDLIPDEFCRDTYIIEAPAEVAQQMTESLNAVVADCSKLVPFTKPILMSQNRVVDKKRVELVLDSGEVAGASMNVGDPGLKVYVSMREGVIQEDEQA